MLKIQKYPFQILYFFSLLLSLIFTFLYLGKANVNILNINWSLYADSASDLINWLSYKNSEWRFPFGNFATGDLDENSIVYSGSVPILAFICKLFFKNLIDFNIFLIWIFLCFKLQLFFSQLIIYNYTKSLLYSLISSLFFVLSPIFINRLGFHFSLASHWIIFLYFIILIKPSKQSIFFKSALICLSSLIHFYFVMMILMMEFLKNIFVDKIYKNNLLYNIKDYLIILVPLISIMFLFGYFTIPIQDSLGYGFGVYKLNLISLFNPQGSNYNYDFNWSNFLPLYKLNYGEKEGFSYLGLGYFVLIIIIIIQFFKKKIKINNYNYIIIILIITLFSLSNKIDFAQFNLINIELPIYVEGFLSIARASGRFIWPAIYFILFYLIISIYSRFKSYAKLIILLLFLLQLLDISNGLKYYINGESLNKKSYNLQSNVWNLIKKEGYILTSTYLKNQSNDFYKILNYLKTNSLNSEIQYFARYNREKLLNIRYENNKNIIFKNLKKNKIYLINNYGHLTHINYLFKNSKDYGIILIDGIYILVHANFIDKYIDNQSSLNIKSKKLNVNQKEFPKFIGDFNEKSYLGLGWTTHGLNNNPISDGKYSSLILDLSDLKEKKEYNLEIQIEGIFVNEKQNIYISYLYDQNYNEKISLDSFEKNKTIKIPLNKKQIENLENFTINFITEGQQTEFDNLLSPDKKKLGFKLISLVIKEL